MIAGQKKSSGEILSDVGVLPSLLAKQFSPAIAHPHVCRRLLHMPHEGDRAYSLWSGSTAVLKCIYNHANAFIANRCRHVLTIVKLHVLLWGCSSCAISSRISTSGKSFAWLCGGSGAERVCCGLTSIAGSSCHRERLFCFFAGASAASATRDR